MEVLKVLSNGQWQLLSKMAWGTPVYDHLKHGENPIKDPKQAMEAKVAAVKTATSDESYKTQKMKNLQSGKDELHVLLHRGIGKNAESDSKGPNMMDWSGKDTIKTSHNSIHTLHPDEAEGHAENAPMDQVGHHHSFWVPISSVHGSGEFMDNHFNAEERGDPQHMIIGPGEYRKERSVEHHYDKASNTPNKIISYQREEK